jgi:energy-coupling factor transporter ATP-binding protein EcfA2
MHKQIGGCLGRVSWRFVGRDAEASKILRWEFGRADILVVGCARGCGKSAFATALSRALAEGGEAEYIMIIDAAGYLMASKGAWKLAEETSKRERYRLAKFKSNDHMVSGYLKDSVRGFVYDVVEAAEGSELEGRLFIFIDGVYLYVKKVVESYRLWLDGMDDAFLHNRLKKGTAKIVIMTSGDSMAAWSTVPHMAVYVRDAMMWNLPRREFEALADALELKDHPELLWSLTGGNPEALVAIWDRGLREWIEFEVSYPAFKGGASCFIAPPCP